MAPHTDDTDFSTARVRDIAGPQRSRYLDAAAAGEPVQVTNHGHPFVTIVASDEWDRASRALHLVDQLAALAERGASPLEYEGLARLIANFGPGQVTKPTQSELPLAM
jgi:prevent-host-death family protein